MFLEFRELDMFEDERFASLNDGHGIFRRHFYQKIMKMM
jgi:hypothetical protein